MKKIFAENGLLAGHLSGFEPRRAQLEMAEAVDAALDTRGGIGGIAADSARILAVEAETGVGKTLAYLVPAVLSGQRLVISTATINLQDQILKKEIQLIARLLKKEIPAICIKGRQNYLCYYRWFQLRSSPQLSFLDNTDCEKIERWLQVTTTGDRAELAWLPDHSPLWAKITAQSHQCLGGDCPEGGLCFINQLRRKAGAARLLIVNHHLFFSDLSLRKEGYGEVLPRYEGVIFDEAHHLENVATTFFGIHFSQYQLLDLLSDIERQAEADLSTSLKECMGNAVLGVKKRLDRFVALFPPERGRYHLGVLINKAENWREEVQELVAGIDRLAHDLAGLASNNEGWRVLEKRAIDLQANLVEIALEEQADRSVCWYERRERSLSLSSTPIRVADHLRQYLYPAVNSCILTSATLTTGGDFSYICERLGLDGQIETLRLQSPFDYSGRTLLYVPEKGFPEPADDRFPGMLCERIVALLQRSKGRALVLFTSLKGMETVAGYLQDHLSYPVLIQGSASRHALLEKFKEETDSVLLAVASFWEGVDVPGESLSCVIIDKLPFEVPSDPVVQARVEAISAAGGKPFFEFQVPRAVLSLRQGVGRLMRASTDRGLIAIMDVRLFTKGYGRIFVASLPPSPLGRSMESVGQFFLDTTQE
ncbi:MAG: ATP-dependent DNA helicase [Desulfocapsaceae bacterium]|nr:ATP-dependent DNA helicase [Desulfocapsaceae bacterium]